MAKNRPFVHPYIPNSVPEVKKRMMEEMGIKDVDELFRDLPARSKLPKLPGPMSEYELSKHIQEILAKNRDDLDLLRVGCCIIMS
jgi:glycine dehydrogenase subunit 1